jgi:predicted DNA-binding ribbon-helix-helix protein
MKRESTYVRLDEQTLARIDALAEEMTRNAHGSEHNRSDALRVVILRGLETIESKKSKR